MSRQENEDGMGMIYLGMSGWDGMWRNRQQIMSKFAMRMPVLYVEPWMRLRQVRKSMLSGRQADGNGQRNLQSVSGRGVQVFQSPPELAVSGSKLLSAITQNRWYAAVRKESHRIGIRKPILWVSRPEFHRSVGRFSECLSIYHIVDEYGGYTSQTDSSRKRLWRHEQELLDSVDISIAVSPELVASKTGQGRDIHLVENAVATDKFETARRIENTPADIGAIPGPRLGYCGLIGQRLDLNLLQKLSEENRRYAIVLIGKVDPRNCEDSLQALRQQENVHFLGEKSVAEVPGYVASFDLGLLPYISNLETRNISPLKMYEYLAAGLPVVSTDIPSARRHEEILHVATSAGEYIDLCRVALEADCDSERERRVCFARSNTWDVRVEQLTELIRSKLEARSVECSQSGSVQG